MRPHVRIPLLAERTAGDSDAERVRLEAAVLAIARPLRAGIGVSVVAIDAVIGVISVSSEVADPGSCAKRRESPKHRPMLDSRGSTAHGLALRDERRARVRGGLAHLSQARGQNRQNLGNVVAYSMGADGRLRALHSAASSIWARACGETRISSGKLNRSGKAAPGAARRKQTLRALLPQLTQAARLPRRE